MVPVLPMSLGLGQLCSVSLSQVQNLKCPLRSWYRASDMLVGLSAAWALSPMVVWSMDPEGQGHVTSGYMLFLVQPEGIALVLAVTS